MTPEEAQEKLDEIRMPSHSSNEVDYFIGFMEGLECGKYPLVEADKEEPWRWSVVCLPEHDANYDSKYIWIGGTGYFVTITLHAAAMIQVVIELANTFKSKIPYMEKDAFYQMRKIMVPVSKGDTNEMFSLILSKLREMQRRYEALLGGAQAIENDEDDFMKGL